LRSRRSSSPHARRPGVSALPWHDSAAV